MKKEKIIRCLNWFLEYNEETYCGGDRIVEGDKKFYYVSDEDLMAFKEAVGILEQNTCEDCIDRQVLIKDIQELIDAWKKHQVMEKEVRGLTSALSFVKFALPVQPKIRVGQWVGHFDTWECSRCGAEFKNNEDFNFDFCPKCGANMAKSIAIQTARIPGDAS